MNICTVCIFTLYKTSKILASNRMSFFAFKHLTLVIHTDHIDVPEVALVTILTVTKLEISAHFCFHISEIIGNGEEQ